MTSSSTVCANLKIQWSNIHYADWRDGYVILLWNSSSFILLSIHCVRHRCYFLLINWKSVPFFIGLFLFEIFIPKKLDWVYLFFLSSSSLCQIVNYVTSIFYFLFPVFECIPICIYFSLILLPFLPNCK